MYNSQIGSSAQSPRTQRCSLQTTNPQTTRSTKYRTIGIGNNFKIENQETLTELMNTSHQTRFRDNSFNIGADTSAYGSKLQSINATEKRSKRPNIITSNSPMFQTINMNKPTPNAPFMPSRPASLPLTTPNRTFVQAPALKSTQKQQRKYRQLVQLKSKLKEEKAQIINKINHMQLRANVALQASKEIQTTFGEPAPKIVIPTLTTADPDQLTENLQHNNSRIGTSTGSFGLPLQPQSLNLDKLYIQNQALKQEQ